MSIDVGFLHGWTANSISAPARAVLAQQTQHVNDVGRPARMTAQMYAARPGTAVTPAQTTMAQRIMNGDTGVFANSTPAPRVGRTMPTLDLTPKPEPGTFSHVQQIPKPGVDAAVATAIPQVSDGIPKLQSTSGWMSAGRNQNYT